jgi:hypothetical protein
VIAGLPAAFTECPAAAGRFFSQGIQVALGGGVLHLNFARKALALAFLLALTAAQAQAQNRVKSAGEITPTRLVWLFQGKESALLEALRNPNPDALGALLADDFVQRSAASPSLPVAREFWVAGAKPGWGKEARISEMAVHEHGPLAVVSFLLADQRRRAFVVDLWRQREAADDYELVTRYLSELPAPKAAPKAQKAHSPAAAKRPSP